jgi:uncharacterized membrane protein
VLVDEGAALGVERLLCVTAVLAAQRACDEQNLGQLFTAGETTLHLHRLESSPCTGRGAVRLETYARRVSTSRLETFADGVFAIAATLLILDVTADARGGQGLSRALEHSWPQYAAYAISFLTIGIIWVNHHTCFEQIGRTDRRFLFINVAFLACVAFIPFPTRLVAEHLRDNNLRAAAIAYGLTLIATAIGFAVFWFYASLGGRLLRADADPRIVSGISRSYIPGAPSYTAATLVALWSPHAAVALFAAIAIFYVLESSFFGRGA